MKKLIIITVFMALVSPVFAQNNNFSEDANVYYVNVPVERVFPTGKGYIVQYRKGFGVATIGIPNEWFTDAGSKAELITLPRGANWPTMTVFYREGEFSHVRLYVHNTRSHPTWGNVPQSFDVSKYFEDPDPIVLEF